MARCLFKDLSQKIIENASGSENEKVCSSPTKVSAWMISEERRKKLLSHPAYEKFKSLADQKKNTSADANLISNKDGESTSSSLMLSPIKSTPIPSTPTKDSTCSPKPNKVSQSPFKPYLSSPSKTFISPTKSSLNTLKNIIPSSPTKRSLELPSSYKQLETVFCGLDYVVCMLHKRQELATFVKVKQAVQLIIRKDFDENKLSQICTVMPDAFKIKFENLSSSQSAYSHSSASSNAPQLIISLPPNSNFHSPIFLLTRKRSFNEKLIEITKEFHKAFLASLDPPIEVDHALLSRWHKDFKLDQVERIIPTVNIIPNAPTLNRNLNSVEGFLEKTRERLGMESQVEVKKNVIEAEKQREEQMKKAVNKIGNGPLKGISTSLLEKIRAKEAILMAKEMTRKPEEERELEMISRLPELIRIIHSYFVGEKKMVVALQDLITKTVNSYHSCIAICDVQQHINLLLKLLPNWIWSLEHKKGTFIKIDKNMIITELVKNLNAYSDKIKKA
ncbi:unnamed protein product [Sphagnum balticum]